jgi:hypothetical protein
MEKMQGAVMSSFFKRIIMLIIAFTVFFGMMWFIWLFPNKVKHYAPK